MPMPTPVWGLLWKDYIHVLYGDPNLCHCYDPWIPKTPWGECDWCCATLYQHSTIWSTHCWNGCLFSSVIGIQIIRITSKISGDYIIYESEAADFSNGVRTHQGHCLPLRYRISHYGLLVSAIERKGLIFFDKNTTPLLLYCKLRMMWQLWQLSKVSLP